nr:hypothetical protein [Chrysiogenes arsenatis]
MPAEFGESAHVHEFAGGAVGFGGVPFDGAVVPDDCGLVGKVELAFGKGLDYSPYFMFVYCKVSMNEYVAKVYYIAMCFVEYAQFDKVFCAFADYFEFSDGSVPCFAVIFKLSASAKSLT